MDSIVSDARGAQFQRIARFVYSHQPQRPLDRSVIEHSPAAAELCSGPVTRVLCHPDSNGTRHPAEVNGSRWGSVILCPQRGHRWPMYSCGPHGSYVPPKLGVAANHTPMSGR